MSAAKIAFMDTSFYPLVSFLLVFCLAIITPGPNFILVVNSSLAESRDHGLVTACGIAVGSLLFALAGLFGLLLVMTSWAPLSWLLSFIGGGYLAWLGITMLYASVRTIELPAHTPLGRLPGKASAFRRGLVTNLSNPKAWAFYLSLFSLMVTPQFTWWGKLLLASCMFLISLGWYMVVALLMTSVRAGSRLQQLHPFIQGTLGAVLLVVAGRLLLV